MTLQRMASLAVFIFAVVLAALLLVLDNEPPKFPLSPSAKVVDCYNLHASGIVNENSRLKFSVEVGDFYEYPEAVAVYLLRVNVTAPYANISFPQPNFWDLVHEGRNISFCVLSTVSGPVNVELICQSHVLQRASLEIPDVQIYPVGYSRFMTKRHSAMLTDVCMDTTQLLYFAQNQISVQPLRRLPVVTRYEPMQSYASARTGTTVLDSTVFIVDIEARTVGEEVRNLLIPLVLAMQEFGMESAPMLVLDDEMKGTVAPFASGNVMTLSNLVCMRNSVYLSTGYELGAVDPLVLDGIRSRFIDGSATMDLVLVDNEEHRSFIAAVIGENRVHLIAGGVQANAAALSRARCIVSTREGTVIAAMLAREGCAVLDATGLYANYAHLMKASRVDADVLDYVSQL